MEIMVPKFLELLEELGPDASGQLTLAQRIESRLFFGILPNPDGTITKPDHPNIHDGVASLLTWKNSVSVPD